MTRVYLPDHADRLAAATPPGRVPADADAVRRRRTTSEEAEYAALMTAADRVGRAARRARPTGRACVARRGRRRTGAAPRAVVAVHVDTDDDADPDDDLAWCATQEIGDLLASL